MAVNGVSITPIAALLPLYILEIYALAVGLAFFLSALNVKYRDTSHIWEIIMQAAFYATPIIYPLALVIEKSEIAAKIIMMNPIAQAVQDARYVLVTTDSVTVAGLFGNSFFLLIPLGLVVAIFLGGIAYFNKHSSHFAETI